MLVTKTLLASASQRAAAVDGIRSASDPTSIVGGEKQYKRRDLFRTTGAAEWMSALRVFEKRSIGLRVHAAAFVNLSNDDTRIHCINSHALRGQLQRRTTRQLVH